MAIDRGRAISEGCRALAIAVLLGAGCRRRPEPPPPPPLTVEFSGCAALRVGPVCEIPENRLIRLWIQAPADAAVTVDAGAGPVAPVGTPVQGGILAPVTIVAGAAAVVVLAARGGAEASFRLALSPRESAPDLDEAEALRQQGKLDEAEARLRGPLADPRPAVALQATRKLARIARSRGRTEQAVGLFEEALPRDRAAGRISDELEDRFALVFTLLFPGRRLTEARRALDAMTPLAIDDPGNLAQMPYFQGWIAYEAGDLRAAMSLFREASERQERLGMLEERARMLGPWADVLSLLGRHREAIALLRKAEALLPPGTSPCHKATLLNDLGWIVIRAREGSERGRPLDTPEPEALLSEAISLHRRHCTGGTTLANYLTNLALAELARGRPAEARARLDEARNASAGPGPRIELWWMILEGRIALELGKPERALGWFERLETLGDRLLLPEARFVGALGRAQALDALGQGAPASKAYAEAEERLDTWSRLVPLGEGRDTFFARHEQSARLRVDFLLRRAGDGAGDEAATAARRSRARLLDAISWVERASALPAEARARWEASLGDYRRDRAALDAASADEWKTPTEGLDRALAARAVEQGRLRASLEQALSRLGMEAAPGKALAAPRAPAEGDLLLVLHPLPEGWAGFALDARGAVARRLGPIDPASPPEQLASALFAPFDEAIARARRVLVAAYGPLDHLDFHALPFRGRPLLAHAPVLYTADLPARSSAEEAGSLAVVVTDPRGDLPAARREADMVTGALVGRGLRVERIERAAATHAAVRDLLERPEARLFHYAGHGVFDGRDGWESALPLARGGWLTIGDIAALGHAPPFVILSGCETARTADDARAAGLSLGHAFVVAGADVVIAASRPVNDRQAARIFGRLYQGSTGDDLPRALRDAELAELALDPSSDWSSFRVMIR